MAYAEQAMEFASDFDNVNVKVINYDEAISMGMGGLVGVEWVQQGSHVL